MDAHFIAGAGMDDGTNGTEIKDGIKHGGNGRGWRLGTLTAVANQRHHRICQRQAHKREQRVPECADEFGADDRVI